MAYFEKVCQEKTKQAQEPEIPERKLQVAVNKENTDPTNGKKPGQVHGWFKRNNCNRRYERNQDKQANQAELNEYHREYIMGMRPGPRH
ncbi:hypothetical protein MSSD14B_08110 [Marinobacter salsuginis]|uniref:Uncharacterized protein n=1 Tax=Marinobacter salsuginis TaxID=418719 RepID=A0A5M3PW73_9GAMM|nr:hypothetical protein MSSD14B_08110 [Marinobacter salsuginis]